MRLQDAQRCFRTRVGSPYLEGQFDLHPAEDMSRTSLASAAAASPPVSAPASNVRLPTTDDDSAHSVAARSPLARDLAHSLSSASSPAAAPRLERTRADVGHELLASAEDDCARISPLLLEEQARHTTDVQQLSDDARTLSAQLASVDNTLRLLSSIPCFDDSSSTQFYDPYLTRRAFNYATNELPVLVAQTAYRRRDLAALAIEARNPLSHLNVLPTLGPLQMVEQYVLRRSTFRAGVVSSEPGRLLCSSPVARSAQDVPFHVGELSDGKFVACTYGGGPSFLQVFDCSLRPQYTVAAPAWVASSNVNDMTITQQDSVLLVADYMAHIMSVDGALLGRFGCCQGVGVRSATQLVDGAFVMLLRDSQRVQICSGSFERQHSFALDHSSVRGYAGRVRVSRDGDIVVGGLGGVQWYRRDGTLLRQFDWSSAPDATVDAFGVAVDAESNVVVADWAHTCVLMLRPDGTVVRTFSAEKLDPAGVAVTADGHIAVCNHISGRRGRPCVQLWS